jgi:hypothetical protein
MQAGEKRVETGKTQGQALRRSGSIWTVERAMKYLPYAILLLLTVVFGAFGTSALAADDALEVDVSVSPDSPRETVLLVSLDDGSVIKQTIRSTADLCFKKNSESATICLTQGAPVIDPVTNAVIGFEMIEDHIDLVAKSD